MQASTMFRFNGWLRFKTLELPFAAISLIWNSMASWAGGWFFLMAAEIFSVGQRNFRLPGLGAYLQEAANQGNFDGHRLGPGGPDAHHRHPGPTGLAAAFAWSDRFKYPVSKAKPRQRPGFMMPCGVPP